MRGRHIRRRLAWPWPEWVGWVLVAIAWTSSSATVWLVMTSASLTVASNGEGVTVTGWWAWPWDR